MDIPDVSDPNAKMCPLLKAIVTDQFGQSIKILPCQKDACAWWSPGAEKCAIVHMADPAHASTYEGYQN